MTFPKAYTNYIDKLVKLFQAKALLMEYDIGIKHTKHNGTKHRYREGYSAEMDVDTRYLDITVVLRGKFYDKWKRKEYRAMAQDMAHELAHVYTDPHYELFWQHVPEKDKEALTHINEQQTERIARLIMLNVRPKDYLPD